jgi:hypothetical protein
MYPWADVISQARFADVTASWIWNEPTAALAARTGEIVRFYKIIDRDAMIERTSPAHRAVVHLIADGDTTCTIYLNNFLLGEFTGGFDTSNYTRIHVELSQVVKASCRLGRSLGESGSDTASG